MSVRRTKLNTAVSGMAQASTCSTGTQIRNAPKRARPQAKTLSALPYLNNKMPGSVLTTPYPAGAVDFRTPAAPIVPEEGDKDNGNENRLPRHQLPVRLQDGPSQLPPAHPAKG